MCLENHEELKKNKQHICHFQVSTHAVDRFAELANEDQNTIKACDSGAFDCMAKKRVCKNLGAKDKM